MFMWSFWVLFLTVGAGSASLGRQPGSVQLSQHPGKGDLEALCPYSRLQKVGI